MLKLTSYEQEMLDGKFGRLKQQALTRVVEYAKVLGAEELCEVSKAHLFCGLHGYLESYKDADINDIEKVLSEMHLCTDEKLTFEPFACYCQSDVGPMDPECYKELGFTEEEGALNRKYLDFYKSLGVNLVGTCIPYLVGFLPLKGEHFVTSESHAVTLLNSFFGACGNSDGLEAGFWAAISGRIPEWGNHLENNRKGTHLFNVDFEVKTNMDWDLLGYTIGRMLPTHSIPVIKGDNLVVDIVTLKYFFAAMATTSGPEMCHIVGHTPDAPTVEAAFYNTKDYETIDITKADMEESFNILNDKDEMELYYITLGCPHYSIDELRYIASLMKGRKKADNVIVHLWTAAPIKERAIDNGYLKDIEDFGAKLLTSSCPLNTRYPDESGKAMLLDSAKQAHYLRPTSKSSIYYRSIEECIDAAVKGKIGHGAY